MRWKPFKILGFSVGGIFGFALFILFILAGLGPETYVVTGPQLSMRHQMEVESLRLIPPGEKIKYFYSDAFLDIKDGMYFVTDHFLVVYCQEWVEPKITINIADITHVEAQYEEAFLEDSYVIVETRSGMEIGFPVSNEKGRDHKFVEHIESGMQQMPSEDLGSELVIPENQAIESGI